MKNILVLFSMVVALIFTSCENGTPTPPIPDIPELPIKNLQLPASSATAPLNSTLRVAITGTGFTSDCQIILTPATKSENVIKAEGIKIANNILTFNAPNVSGEYRLALNQGGHEFPLGTIHFMKYRLVKEITYTSEHQSYSRKFEYDENQRPIKIDMLDSAPYNDIYAISYSDSKILVTLNGKLDTECTLDNSGRISKATNFSSQKNNDITLGYSTDNQLISRDESSGYGVKFNWSDGNIDKETLLKGRYTTYTHGDKPNYSNLYICSHDIFQFGIFVGSMGVRERNFLTSSNAVDDIVSFSMTTAYEFDDEGFPITVTITSEQFNDISAIYTVSYF